MNNSYGEGIEALESILAEAEAVCLVIDSWTSAGLLTIISKSISPIPILLTVVAIAYKLIIMAGLKSQTAIKFAIEEGCRGR
jgi:hypothetical protein